jgi:hypothetical protein
MKRYWKKIKSIARDQGLTIAEARQAAWKGRHWKVVIRIEDYLGRRSEIDIAGTFYVEADTAEQAKRLGYKKILDWFDRDEEKFVPFKKFKAGAFAGHEKQRGLLKWRHAKGKWQKKEL